MPVQPHQFHYWLLCHVLFFKTASLLSRLLLLELVLQFLAAALHPQILLLVETGVLLREVLLPQFWSRASCRILEVVKLVLDEV